MTYDVSFAIFYLIGTLIVIFLYGCFIPPYYDDLFFIFVFFWPFLIVIFIVATPFCLALSLGRFIQRRIKLNEQCKISKS